VSEAPSARLGGGTELVQPAVIRLHNSLIQVYRIMRERQKDIDAAFDRVAAQIGFVVTTTLPVRVEVAEEGAVKKVSFDGEALRGTIFEKELSGFLQEFGQKPFSGVPAGTYRFYLIWFDALNLKLRFDCCESVHILQGVLGSFMSRQAGISASTLVRPEVREPAQWFDPGLAIVIEDALVIMAIDEVYPELRLAERISAGRLAISQLRSEPGWHHAEMAPFPVYFSERFGNKETDLLAKVRALLGKQLG
jgi:hypothetical protein